VNKEICIIIPALNEEKNIGKILKKFRKIGKTIVINDNSSDSTKKIANKFCYKIITNTKRLGYDHSIRKGIEYTIKNEKKIKYILTIDADGQHYNIPIKNIIKKLSFYDLIICNRNKFNRISEKIISLVSFALYSIKDPISGVKCYKLETIKKKFFLLKKKRDYIGMFFFKLYNKKKIFNIEIKINNKNKISSFGEGLKINLKILTAFINSI
jgi:cellulose synthase/poly-beta-1,6-N-acetylglucosamine synthase-like glycosyltransferase